MKIILSFYHWILAALGSVLYGFPSRKIFVVGVTGTKGKSTTLDIMASIMEKAGYKTAVFNSVRRKIASDDKTNLYGNSMPGRFALQKFLSDAVNAKCEYAFVEVTSQGAVQHRHKFILWDAAVFTNLHPEHIESHGSFEEYRNAKLSFFEYVAKSPKPHLYFLTNKEDESSKYFDGVAMRAPRAKIGHFSRKDLAGDIMETLNEWLSTEFNLENAACAAVFGRMVGVSHEAIKRALGDFHGIAGRMEFVQREPFRVVVDYAHTPESLEAIYKALKPKNGRLISILGSDGGGRDKWKRPVMGEIAARWSDIVIFTEENPYDEDPQQIINELKSHINNSESRIMNGTLYEITDRREAIKKGIKLALSGDTVVMTGKGSEPWLYLPKGRRISWSDAEIAREALRSKE